jgi:hypothetical protein
MPRRKTQDEFISDINRVHGERYDYSKAVYVNNRSKVILKCKLHGEFLIRPNSLIDSKQGCPDCGRIQANKNIRLNWNKVLKRFKKVHGNTYDYKPETYIDYTTKMVMVCKIHGEFLMKPHTHVGMKAGCKNCGYIKTALKNIIPLEEIIRQFDEVHNSFYEYDLSSYKGVENKIRIRCPKHGWFEQKVASHKSGQGCRKCSNELSGDRTRVTLIMWLEESKLIHGEIYDYSKVKWVDQYTPVLIGCDVKDHGYFEQSPRDHKRGAGCIKCNSSRGEMAVSRWLTEQNIEFISQWSTPRLRYKSLLYCDFYLPKYNFVIEYNGIQHYKPIDLFDGEKGYKQTIKRDIIKKNFCIDNGIGFSVIKYDEDVKKRMDEIFSAIKNNSNSSLK